MKNYKGFSIRQTKVNGVKINLVNATGFTDETARRNLMSRVNEYYGGDTQSFIKEYGSNNIIVNHDGSFKLSTF